MEEDAVVSTLKKMEKEWEEKWKDANAKVEAVAACRSVGDSRNLPRLNAIAQDALSEMQSLAYNMKILIPQHPSEDAAEGYEQLLRNWEDAYETLRRTLRTANINAKSNIEKSAIQEREMLFSGGREGTLRRRNLETQAGMVFAAENITESLRRTRQLMVQEIDRNSATLSVMDQSNKTLEDAEREYSSQTTLFSTTKRLLSTMTRHDVIDKLILVVGFLFFTLVCLYILKRRILPRRRYSSPILPVTNPPALFNDEL